ncbi:MAG: hypothetical protein EPO40_25080 [Myxococcaceae bacterium]|nr:MAG: hypothetical protein EPO40_25080 [Myxococcaceae bacterium]
MQVRHQPVHPLDGPPDGAGQLRDPHAIDDVHGLGLLEQRDLAAPAVLVDGLGEVRRQAAGEAVPLVEGRRGGGLLEGDDELFPR